MLRLLMSEPTVLLLDEPSNDIDIQTLDWLEGIIQKWDDIVLFISHDEILIEHAANMVIHLEQIKRKSESRYTVARVPYLQYRKERAALFEKQEQQALNDRREKKYATKNCAELNQVWRTNWITSQKCSGMQKAGF